MLELLLLLLVIYLLYKLSIGLIYIFSFFIAIAFIFFLVSWLLLPALIVGITGLALVGIKNIFNN
ncbi:hypothetical protein [Lactobacillus psittaci]|uniref:Uncharacterized protein n=1 Tax=Lactobacillus psittaci DSM 15354 TaxID=1122152 RepID=A0A0R1SD22_9LACO|nr:hypothetical protein [Lactobacillus psittaci]KRL63864.1 hypothetical protein FC23_GL000111 [Lactobacillus psittaci DSM 15354]